MTDQETTRFSGVAGRVLWGTISLRSLVTGVLLGLTLFITNWILTLAQAESFIAPLNHILFAFVVARFVLNGQFGEWQGSVLSPAGGSWVDVIQVGLRYLTLSFVWLLPLIFAGLRPEFGMQMMEKKTIILYLIYLIASVLTPPLLLIVSVSAENFADLFSSKHWQDLFAGRMNDLFSIYAVYTGGMTMAVLLSAPTVLIAFAMHWEFGVFVAGVGLCFLLGMSIDLLGRLCGFFALGDLSTLDAVSSAQGPRPAGVVPPIATATVKQPVAEVPASAPAPRAASPAKASPTPTPSVEAASPALTPPPISTPKKPPLLNAKEHVDEIMERLRKDPGAAICALDDLNVSYAANPQVLSALCICHSRAGQTEDALRLAGEALSLTLERGHSQLAADIFRQLRTHAGKLNLNREQVLTIANAAATKGDLSTAGEAYSMIIGKDPSEIRAIKGLLQVAERILREKHNAAVAIKVYRFLEQPCAGTPMAEHVSTGIAAAERRLEATPTPA